VTAYGTTANGPAAWAPAACIAASGVRDAAQASTLAAHDSNSGRISQIL